MPEPQVVEMKSAAELKGDLPPTVPPTADLQPPLDDNAVRAVFQKAAAQGIEDMNAPAPALSAAPPPMTAGQSPQAAPAVKVPEKFKKPDGTVDEEKLKASSRQLDEAIETKQKSIEDILADYKAKQKEFTQVSQQRADLERQRSVPPPAQQMPPDMQAIQQQIAQDFQRDPLGTSLALSRIMTQKEVEERMAPVEKALESWQEERRDGNMRQNIAQLAQSDPRVLDPRLYGMMQQVLAEDPGMYRLKNPHKAAWNEVKERLRLGEPQQAPARPSTPTPTLGSGTPPFAPALPRPESPQSLAQEGSSVHPLTDEGKAYEQKLREATASLWQQ